MADKPEPKTCCLMRRKQPVLLAPYLSEQESGIPDSILSDFMRFDLEGPVHPNGKRRAVLGFKFCGWCGKRFEQTSEVSITDVVHLRPMPPPDEESGEEWKNG